MPSTTSNDYDIHARPVGLDLDVGGPFGPKHKRCQNYCFLCRHDLYSPPRRLRLGYCMLYCCGAMAGAENLSKVHSLARHDYRFRLAFHAASMASNVRAKNRRSPFNRRCGFHFIYHWYGFAGPLVAPCSLVGRIIWMIFVSGPR